MLRRILVGLVAGIPALACSSPAPGIAVASGPGGSGPPPPSSPPPPPSPPPMAAVPSGIPEPIVVSFEIVRVLKARDREALARLTHSSARAAVAARPLDASDFWVQAAASESSSQARSDGTRWLVRFAELAPEEVAVLVLARDGGPLRLLDVQRMSRAAYEAFGNLAS